MIVVCDEKNVDMSLGQKLFKTSDSGTDGGSSSSSSSGSEKSSSADIIESDIIISAAQNRPVDFLDSNTTITNSNTTSQVSTEEEEHSSSTATTTAATAAANNTQIHFTCSGDDTDSFSASTSVSRSVTPPNDSSSGYNSISKCTCMSRSSPSSELENFSSSFKKFTYENNLGRDAHDPSKLTSIRSTADIFGRTFAAG